MLFRTLLALAALATLPASTAVAVPQRSQAVFERLDLNNDGLIARSEFVATRRGRFVELDRNNDAFLSSADIPRLAGPASRRAASATTMIAVLDHNRDGRVDLAEFQAASLTAFATADLDRNGALTRSEAALAEAQLASQFPPGPR